MRQTLLLGLVVATIAMPALADDDYQDRARVISVTPQVERVNSPRQECSTEYVRETYYEAPQRSLGGAILGGLTGGLVGSRFGGGNGRIATAAIGAGVGAIVGDRIDNNGQANGRERVQTRPVDRCVTVDNWQTVNAGYLVNYEYNGRQYSTVMDRDPGPYVPLQVAVRASGGNVYNADWDDGNRGRGNGHRKNQDRRYW
ncbi:MULTISPECIES: glycine zipper 2TM domain-containing protein [Methylotenera]|uniref:glycine zipper 2TM domain-containing protein n=1 Tax=Methylotenera TaxID=359407 RepID=UPI00037FEB83|nr:MULTISPECIES: glycine zipper 2TM domain-containing protein [Methylotenera]